MLKSVKPYTYLQQGIQDLPVGHDKKPKNKKNYSLKDEGKVVRAFSVQFCYLMKPLTELGNEQT